MLNLLNKQVFILLFLVPFIAESQKAFEPYLGYGIDLAFKKSLSQVNIGLQYPAINHRIYQMVIRVQGGLPLNKYSGNDAAYTSDPILPLSITTGYETKWYSCAVTLGNRFRLISWTGKNILSLFVNAGFIYQNIVVRYDSYNSEKYTVLNPHRSLKKIGLCIGGGVQYKHKLDRGSIFLQIEFFSSPIVKSLNNYHYNLPVPFATNLGYIIEFKKRNK